jgi:hypothetical protein
MQTLSLPQLGHAHLWRVAAVAVATAVLVAVLVIGLVAVIGGSGSTSSAGTPATAHQSVPAVSTSCMYLHQPC